METPKPRNQSQVKATLEVDSVIVWGLLLLLLLLLKLDLRSNLVTFILFSSLEYKQATSENTQVSPVVVVVVVACVYYPLIMFLVLWSGKVGFQTAPKESHRAL